MIGDLRTKLRLSTSTTGENNRGGKVAESLNEPSVDSVSHPWDRKRFQHPEKGSKDVWDTSMTGEGWLVRVHRTDRVRLFMPFHGTLPVRGDLLTGTRCSVMFFDDKSQTILTDDWHQGPLHQNKRFRGFTFFELKGSGIPASTSSRPQMRASASTDTEDAATDAGSFEWVSK
eukprot:Skav216833  [mRNA]  locus=scaffold1340:61790:62308:+ [translate_table: standard]